MNQSTRDENCTHGRLFAPIEPDLGVLEHEYRLRYFDADVNVAYVATIFWALVAAVFSRADLLIYQDHPTLMALLAARGFFILFSGAIMFLLKRIHDPDAYDRLMFTSSLAAVALGLYVNTSRPESYVGYAAIDVLALMTFYLVIPNRLIFRVIPSLVFTLGNLAILFLLKPELDSLDLNVVVITLGLTNLLGLIASTRLYSTRRAQFKAEHELRQSQERLKELAETDHLTGLANRRRFFEIGEEEFKRFKRYKRPFSLLLMDLDHFKRINDNFGHPAGDAVLRTFADTVADHVRETDLSARIGGEEFAVVMPETELAEAVSVAERVRDLCRAMRIESIDPGESITVSIGVAQAENADCDFSATLKRADNLLYHAKSNGRDRVESLPLLTTK